MRVYQVCVCLRECAWCGCVRGCNKGNMRSKEEEEESFLVEATQRHAWMQLVISLLELVGWEWLDGGCGSGRCCRCCLLLLVEHLLLLLLLLFLLLLHGFLAGFLCCLAFLLLTTPFFAHFFEFSRVSFRTLEWVIHVSAKKKNTKVHFGQLTCFCMLTWAFKWFKVPYALVHPGQLQ